MDPIDDELSQLAPDELTTLKARADTLGLKYHPSISLEKLREKLTAALADAPAAEPEVGELEEESLNARRARKRKEANQLIRIRVACMNPAKKEWEGELFTAGNSLVGSFTKFVPFDAEDGWHVPKIIYNQIVQRQCQVFTTVRDKHNNAVRKGKLIREFAVEILPNLSMDELKDLAQRQAMSKSID